MIFEKCKNWHGGTHVFIDIKRTRIRLYVHTSAKVQGITPLKKASENDLLNSTDYVH